MQRRVARQRREYLFRKSLETRQVAHSSSFASLLLLVYSLTQLVATTTVLASTRRKSEDCERRWPKGVRCRANCAPTRMRSVAKLRSTTRSTTGGRRSVALLVAALSFFVVVSDVVAFLFLLLVVGGFLRVLRVFSNAHVAQVAEIDDEYARAGIQDPKVVITTCRDPSVCVLFCYFCYYF